MLVVMAPAKTLDFSPAPAIDHASQSLFLDEAGALIQRLRELAPLQVAEQVAELMGISTRELPVNLASQQHFRSVRRESLQMEIITPIFQGLKGRNTRSSATTSKRRAA